MFKATCKGMIRFGKLAEKIMKEMSMGILSYLSLIHESKINPANARHNDFPTARMSFQFYSIGALTLNFNRSFV